MTTPPDPLSDPLSDPTPSPPPALVLVAHGSRDPRALTTVHALAARVRALRPDLPVHLGHLELNAPLLPETLATLAPLSSSPTPGAILVPLLLSRGYHVKRDIPDLAATTPLRTTVTPPLGPHPLLAEALHTRLTEAGWPSHLTDRDRRTTAVVLAAAGSRDPEAARDTARTARLLAARLGVPVRPAYASAARPTVPEAISALRAEGRPRTAVASYFTAPGRFATQCAAESPWLASSPLGTHPALPHLILHRYTRATRQRPSRGAGNRARLPRLRADGTRARTTPCF
ncbi:sirohydrochlorin chelatase [Streptomyces sp. NPDC093252]|uniref:sirohydrochlorin chelatase n=1 Tax=Streptomyces sp. NPDC093252 TaxID=3154980 RepID=UPI003441505A